MRNNVQNENLSKNNTNTKNSLNLEYSINSSNVLTSNHFYLSKEFNTARNSQQIIKSVDKVEKDEKIKKNEKEINIKENKIIGNNNKNTPQDTLIIHNKILANKNLIPKLKKVKSEYEIYQDYAIEEYKNAYNNKDQRNIIEKLGACIEKKFNNNNINNINPINKIKNESSINYKESAILNEYDKNTLSFISKRVKHSYSTSHILEKKNQNEFPILINSPLSYEKKFSSHSEKERNDKNISALIKLKHFLNLYWKQRKDIIEEFFQKNNIYGSYFYEEKCLYNFANYINDNIYTDITGTKCNIETRFPMLEIILKGIKYKQIFSLKKKDTNKIKIKLIKQQKVKRIESGDELDKEKELENYSQIRDKVEKYRNFLDRNYKKSVIDRLLKRLTKEEKLLYFSEKKYGEIEIQDQQNLANNIHKQASYQKLYDSLTNERYSKRSIKFFNHDDLNKLNEELKEANDSVFKRTIDHNKIREKEKVLGIKNFKLNDKIIDKLNQRLYYTLKVKYHKNNPEVIPKKKQKLLEYIIAKRIKERKDFEDKILQKRNQN